MGRYSSHWDAYRRQVRRDTLLGMALFALGIAGVAGTGYLLEPFDDENVVIFLIVAVGWLAVLTAGLVRASRVSCPQCTTRYLRGKFLAICPKCGLRLLQDE